ncbi:uxuA superfamily protein [Acidianus hospitalis W1]|uniref:mannonate dehydratase n=1 Tax=Acidianus hospitalis (strain W1) TaxID=933801 RepID=F4B6X0_ACIHW|nr:mannonate dehydratase [Acidianus hospitalis]AEE94663.1 uxuA superfamily protein [Acidianus hospitalis W1]
MNEIPRIRIAEILLDNSPTLWKNLEEFLKFILPIAEDAGVKLAIHPDDPPIDEVMRVARIMNNVEAFERLINEFPSEYNGITFDHSLFSLMTDDLVSVVRHFLEKKRIFSFTLGKL